MNLAQANGVPWLWWDWYNPYGTDNNLSLDGSADNLTVTGRLVVNTHAASVANTARLACSDGVASPPVVTPPPEGIFIDAGGPAADNFVADRSFAAGHEAPRASAAIDRGSPLRLRPRSSIRRNVGVR